ncbi:hypothetical protein [Thetidibacter halocola]|uniref:Uncharacterized protein n=1 Tax=Thetidibacter halocola TaxID=2827239 RepID=A0A8J7W9L0_9RHOB|nr:hypothetical protein [Thetidibacter halocola]MBS0123490.1 hypothetical protein [Thetidibacter halocola]
MKGFTIFRHSLLLVLRNWQEALRIGALPVLAVMLVGLLTIGPAGFAALQAEPETLDPALASGVILTVLVGMVAMLVIVVNWHRFVLLEEYPGGWVPSLHPALVLGYFGRFLLLSLLMSLALFPVLFVVGLFGPASVIVLPIVMLGLTILFYRLAVILPAGAIGQPITLAQAWEATKGSSPSILMAMLLLFLVNVVAQTVVTILALVVPILALALSLPVSVVLALAGVSILTTLHGHYVEGRPID